MTPDRWLIPLSLAVVAACGDLPTTQTAESIDAGTPSAAASTGGANLVLASSWGTYNPCTNEQILLEGRYHLSYRFVATPTGTFQWAVHTDGQYSGTGATGTVYHGTDVSRTNYVGGGGDVFTFVVRDRIISSGQADNLIINILFRATTTANGDLSAEIVSFTVECEG